MRTVIALLHEGARKFGDMPYLGQKVDGVWVTWSFRETDRLSACFAAALLERGFGKDGQVAILAEGQASWVTAEFGLLKAGCVSVPLSTKLSGDEIRFRLEHSGSLALLVSENALLRVTPIIKDMKSPPLLIGISEASEGFRGLAEREGLVSGRDIVFYDDLVARGEALLYGSEGGETAGEAGGEGPWAERLAAVEAGITESDTVTICYTSGTTGNPKGIMLTHLNYWDNAHASAEVVPIETGWKSLIMLPLDHSFAHTVGIYIFLYKGLCMYFVDAKGGPLAALRNLPVNLVEVEPDFLLTVPALSGNFMKKIQEGVAKKGALINGIFTRGVAAGIRRAGNGFDKPSLLVRLGAWFPWWLAKTLVFPKVTGIFGSRIKFCIGGGALLEIRQQEFFNAIGVPVYQGYGLTENSPIICSNSSRRHKFGTSGVIIPSLRVRIMKDEVSECGVGEAGQIVTRGDSVMKGYFRNPEATAATLRDGWLWSGDLGYKDKDGFLVVTGREKALLISMDGEKYSPETIEEAVINTSRFVNQVMAYNEQCRFTIALLTPDVPALQAEIARRRAAGEVVDARGVLDLVKADLQAFYRHADYSKIPVQWRPASFVLIPEAFGEDHGLVNSTLKLVRHKVRDHYRARIDEAYAGQAPDVANPGNLAAVKALGLGD